MTVRLVLLRHAKSDWDVGAPDRERPLAARGRRQAAEAGEWLAWHEADPAPGRGLGPGLDLALDLALVSPARRARETWRLASDALAHPPPVRSAEAAYTFDGDDLLDVVRGLTGEDAAALVGHNPALEELVQRLTGAWVPMKTSALAVVELDGWKHAGRWRGRLLAHGRPPA